MATANVPDPTLNRPAYKRYALPVISIFVIFILKDMFVPLAHHTTFVLFFAPTLLSAWYGGFGPGLCAAVLATVLSDYYFVGPGHLFYAQGFRDNLSLGLFLAEGIFLSWLGGRFHAEQRLRAQRERQLELAYGGLEAKVAIRTAELAQSNEALRAAAAERMRADAALAESEDRQRMAIEAAQLGMWFWDILEDRRSWTPLCKRMHGLPAEAEVSFDAVLACIHPEDRQHYTDTLKNVLTHRAEYRDEYRVVWPNGQVRWISAMGRVSLDESGLPRRMMGAVIDSTQKKEFEEALKAADRRKDEFLAVLGHELRNPLAPIRTAVHVLRRLGSSDERLQRARDMIDRQVTQMARLIDDLLDVSRITRGKILLRKEPMDLVAVARTTTEDYRPILEANGLTVELNLPEQKLPMQGDSARVSQIVGNLLQNAVKFTDPGGTISVRLWREGGQACLTVADSGIGMSPEVLRWIFEPFHQAQQSVRRSRGGLGLGLALVRGLVSLHGGKVSASSDGPGHGSKFTLEFPLEENASMRPKPVEAPAVTGHGRRILVIEDNLDAAESLHLLLELSGHQVVEAHDAADGLAKAHEYRPEIVLCDIGLPGEMDGYAVARELRHDPALRTAYLIAMTGYGQEEDRRRARDAGFDKHLTKPADPSMLDELLAAVPA